MEFTYPVGEYRTLLDEYIQLEKLAFPAGSERQLVLEKLEERSRRKRVIADAANTIVHEYIERYEADPDALTAEAARQLWAFEDSLTDSQTHQTLDLGITLRLQRLRKAWYERCGDLPRYARALQDCVGTELRLFANHSNNYAGSAYTEECLRLAARLEELPRETWPDLLVTLYRLPCCHEKGCAERGSPGPMEQFLRIDDFLRAHLNVEDPDLTAAAAARGIAFNVLLQFNAYCVWERQNGRTANVERYRDRIERFAAILRAELESGRPIHYAERPNIESYLLRAEYHLGRISIEDLLAGLDRLQSEAADNEDSLAKAARLAALNYYYLLYLYRFSGYDAATITELSQAHIRAAMPKILRITRSVNSVRFNYYMVMFLNGASYTSSFEDYANTILELTVYADKALYVHTVMVRELSYVIFDALLERDPDYFCGVAGYDGAAIHSHPDTLRALLGDCCMFHDIGKFFMLDIVENSMRTPTEDEFRLIRYHPEGFEDLYESWEAGDERLQCIHDCALTHHLWHDGTNGYPAVPQTRNRPFADILAIADALDASTDFYGRPFGTGKELEAMLAEFRAGAGTRYGPAAVQVLADPAVRARLQWLITEGRKDVYYEIYAFGKSTGDSSPY